MILSDMTLRGHIFFGDDDKDYISVYPVTVDQIQPASVDITLGTTFLEVSPDHPYDIITFDTPIEYKKVVTDKYVLHPKHFVLATTREFFRLPADISAFVEGRSSIGRMGLFIQNAGWVDPGFHGEITLELFNATNHPILLEAGRRVGQMVFAQLDRVARNPYHGKYQNQKEATGSRIYLDKENKAHEND